MSFFLCVSIERYVVKFEDEDLETRLLDPLRIPKEVEGWHFQNSAMDISGVENLNQIFGFRKDLEELFYVASNDFLRSPVDVLGWEIPVYQHPSWQHERVLERPLK